MRKKAERDLEEFRREADGSDVPTEEGFRRRDKASGGEAYIGLLRGMVTAGRAGQAASKREGEKGSRVRYVSSRSTNKISPIGTSEPRDRTRL